MSDASVLTFKCAMGDVTLHFVENVLVERLQSLREIARRAPCEMIFTNFSIILNFFCFNFWRCEV